MKACKFFLVLLLVVSILPALESQETWRSSLYPENWTPGYKDSQGRFLHDFSYAGYHNGEDPLPSSPSATTVHAVAQFHADNSGQRDATEALQKSIDAVSATGGIVFLPSGTYLCKGTLSIKKSGVVLKGEGAGKTKLLFPTSANMNSRGHLTVSGAVQQGPDRMLVVDGQILSREIFLDSIANLSVGDDISIGWVITDEFIAEHLMTGTWKAFNGKWRPFFKRSIVGLDPATQKVILDVPLRYPVKMRDKASVRKETGYISECGIQSLSISNAVEWEEAWKGNRVTAILWHNVKDCWMKDVHSFASAADDYHLQSGGVRVSGSKRITLTGCRMQNPQHRGVGGNGYLFEITTCNEILIQNCIGSAGRHNFIQNWDFGTNGCVFTRCTSEKGWGYQSIDDPIGHPAFSEYHHSLTMACLVDHAVLKDGWYGGNRKDWSSGAGHSVTQSVYWNTTGGGILSSWQYGWGYVIGTSDIMLVTVLLGGSSDGTEPKDMVEGEGEGEELVPRSLYEDQMHRRIQRGERLWQHKK